MLKKIFDIDNIKVFEEIKKGKGKYTHITKTVYKNENIKNMKKSWKEGVKKFEEWFDNYDKYKEEIAENAVKAFDHELQQRREQIDKLMMMSEEERFKFWQSKLNDEIDELRKFEDSREKVIQETIEQSTKVLNQYKEEYTKQYNEKVSALQRWDV